MMLLMLLWFSMMTLLIGLELVLLLSWQWPKLKRTICCPWCWRDCHLMRWFPSTWSSTICHKHEQVLRSQSAIRRAHRLAARAIMRTELSQEQEALL
ncbi:MAG: hypothetical protein M3Z24_09565 [Chloroflexota bacterium]|nr:hypothetical protein [Chloroflexota bacterium]